MIMKKKMIKNYRLTVLLAFFITGCTLSPGMYMTTNKNFSEQKEYVYIESIGTDVEILDINSSLNMDKQSELAYRIGNGDQISITIWGLPDIFPISNINPDQNLRRVDSKGNIYFPYVGLVQALGKTQNELREDLRQKLSDYFTDPQLDVSIARFNSQKVYLLGEITIPSKIFITDIPLSLSEALGEVKGISTSTANGSEVFIIRQQTIDSTPLIFRADLSSPAYFLDAGNFYLKDNDIVYVNAKSTTRWNRVISQFFPFSSFLNSIDNLIQSD